MLFRSRTSRLIPPGALRFFHELSKRGGYQGDYPLTVDAAGTLLANLVKR